MQECTKGIMVAEFERGREICAEANPRKGGKMDFKRLTEAFNFFGPGSYGNYLQVVVAASSEEDFAKWSGYMNSRVKHLTARLHNIQGQLLARPWPKEFKVPMCATISRCHRMLNFLLHLFHAAAQAACKLDALTGLICGCADNCLCDSICTPSHLTTVMDAVHCSGRMSIYLMQGVL